MKCRGCGVYLNDRGDTYCSDQCEYAHEASGKKHKY